jgi:hypothetical protein
VRFLSLLLAFQQAQVHPKRDSYVTSIAFSILDVLSALHVEMFHQSIPPLSEGNSLDPALPTLPYHLYYIYLVPILLSSSFC